MFFDIFLIFSILAIIEAVRALILINRAEYRAALGRNYAGYMVAAVIGLLGGMVRPASTVLAIMGVALMR